MGAELEVLSDKEYTLYNLISWMELAYSDTVYVIDVDLDTGGVILYGDVDKTTKFRRQLRDMMNRIEETLTPWNEGG